MLCASQEMPFHGVSWVTEDVSLLTGVTQFVGDLRV